jgi:hypothetical protein
METQLWAFEVYMRKGKLLLALSAMKRALAISGPADPTAHRMVVRFALQAQDSSRPVRLSYNTTMASPRASVRACVWLYRLLSLCVYTYEEL